MSSTLTDPNTSAWVSASAGTGKTKLLIDRIARLLLAGAAPGTLLCLTYTRAAAGEMAERLQKILIHWQHLPDDELEQTLTTLLKNKPHKTDIARARSLASLCQNEPVVIQTLHSFAQTLIKRAGDTRRLIEGFELSNLWQKAVRQTFHATKDRTFWSQLAEHKTWNNVDDLLWQIYQNRFKWLRIRTHHQTLEAEHNVLEALIPAPPIDRHHFDEEWHTWENHPFFPSFGQKCPWLEWASKPDIQELFLTKKGEPRKRAPKHPLMTEWQNDIVACRYYALHKKWLLTNQALKAVAAPALQTMEKIKQTNHVWDYSDLLEQAMNLLENDPTTIERLHGQLHHVLVDEAQDTSPEQWAIIRFLVRAFLCEEDRTLFVVGDLKQSIYSFQGADPNLFLALEKDFADHFQGRPWVRATLDASWRSTAPVLNIVDAIFHTHIQGVYTDSTPTFHQLTRHDAPGRVVLWPLVPMSEQGEKLPWRTPPVQQSPSWPLALDIAERIENILKSGEILPSTHAPVQPSDIWVLLTRRGPLMRQIEKALVARNIPTSGVDRIDLWRHLLVQDVMALARFVLLPSDDWSLACVLKSPLMEKPLSEEDLYQLCHDRKDETVWNRLQQTFPDHAKSLQGWRNLWMEGIAPSVWFTAIFHTHKIRIEDFFGHTADDIIAAFLEEVYHFEQHNSPSLQAFVAEERDDSIKRQANPDQGVHLTTVHSSKGLQAPIIILADSTDVPRPQQDDFVWSYNPPYMALRPTKEHLDLKDLYDQHTHAIESENRRLFYVALTRAADQLYATGISKDTTKTWYGLMDEALGRLGQTDTLCHGEFVTGAPWQRQSPQPRLHHKINKNIYQTRYEPVSAQSQTKEAERGIILHRWLEIMTLTSNPQAFLVKNDPKGLVDLAQLQTYQSWLSNPDLAWMFQGQGEVDIIDQQGNLKRIDRLVVRENNVWVLDFKTGNPGDKNINTYRAQMESYRQPLQVIYPNHTVHCCIVYVNGDIPQIEHF